MDVNHYIEIREECVEIVAAGKVPLSVIQEKCEIFAEPSELSTHEAASFAVRDDLIPADVMREIIELGKDNS